MMFGRSGRPSDGWRTTSIFYWATIRRCQLTVDTGPKAERFPGARLWDAFCDGARNVNERVVGMAGLGLLGRALAERFVRAGYVLHGFDPDSDCRRAFESLGGCGADSLESLAERARRFVF